MKQVPTTNELMTLPDYSSDFLLFRKYPDCWNEVWSVLFFGLSRDEPVVLTLRQNKSVQ